jgi:hypothetical protein
LRTQVRAVSPIPDSRRAKSRFRFPRRIELFGQLSILSRNVEENFLQFWIIAAGGICFVVDRIGQVFSRFVGIARHDTLPLTGGSAIGLSATDAWRRAVAGDGSM